MADRIVADQKRIFYLAGQYPAINHGYLLAEVQQLRKCGLDVSVASISPPDRPLEQLSQTEREEAARTYYIKTVPLMRAALIHFSEFLLHPLRYLRGMTFSLQISGGNLRKMLFHLAYFAEAILVGHRMRESAVPHVMANFSATVALIAARTFPVTMSFTVHGFGELYDPVGTCLEQRIQGSLFVRSVSRYGRAQLMLASERSQWSKLLYFPLGIDTAEFSPAPNRKFGSPPRLLCVGRLAPEKGQGLLLEAIAALRAERCEVHLRLAGDGPDRDWLERRAAELGILGSVEFVGWVDRARLRDLYDETDLFVLSSLAEGIPIVLMEAMAMQIPCVAPRIAGIPELIDDGVSGMLYTVADVQELTQKICALIRSPETSAQMGIRGRARVLQEYDMAANTERFAAAVVERLDGSNVPT